jgi:SRSO17 transposase
MDAATILEIRPALTAFLSDFDDCFGQARTRAYLDIYVAGQLSDLDRKSVEPMADAAGVPPRSLQEFLSLFKWDEFEMRDRLQRRVATRHADPNSVGVIDETSFIKKGDQTACVQRQHCGAAGKVENCVVSVHLGYVAGDFHTLLDGELYVPQETWHDDRERCRAAGIPDDVLYRPKWRMALDQVQRALGNGVRFGWITFDEGYGGKPAFLRGLAELGQNYVGEIPASFVGWTVPPPVLHRDHARDLALARGAAPLGRPRKLPRLKVKRTPACEVRELLKHSPLVRKVPWQRYRVKDGTKGPMVWEAKCVPLWIKDENGLPDGPVPLLIARNMLKSDEVKFFLSNAPLGANPAASDTPIETLLLVALSRWHIERLFEDSKSELGLDHFEARKFGAITRHLLLTCVSHLFLAEFVQARRGKKSRPDRVPGAKRNPHAGTAVARRRTVFPKTGGSAGGAIDRNTTAKRRRRQEPPQANPAAIAGARSAVA